MRLPLFTLALSLSLFGSLWIPEAASVGYASRYGTTGTNRSALRAPPANSFDETVTTESFWCSTKYCLRDTPIQGGPPIDSTCDNTIDDPDAECVRKSVIDYGCGDATYAEGLVPGTRIRCMQHSDANYYCTLVCEVNDGLPAEFADDAWNTQGNEYACYVHALDGDSSGGIYTHCPCYTPTDPNQMTYCA